MPFVRAPIPKYFAPASYSHLAEDGQLVVSKYDCQFKRLKQSELRQLRQDASKWAGDALAALRKSAEALATVVGTEPQGSPAPAEPAQVQDLDNLASRNLLERVMTGWRGVQAPDGSDLPFSMTSLDQTEEEFPGFINACAQSFWASCHPTAAAHLAAKN